MEISNTMSGSGTGPAAYWKEQPVSGEVWRPTDTANFIIFHSTGQPPSDLSAISATIFDIINNERLHSWRIPCMCPPLWSPQNPRRHWPKALGERWRTFCITGSSTNTFDTSFFFGQSQKKFLFIFNVWYARTAGDRYRSYFSGIFHTSAVCLSVDRFRVTCSD